jgi:hypothetical protein
MWIGGNPFARTCLSPKMPAHDPHMGTVVLTSWYRGAVTFLSAAEGSPRAESRAFGRSDRLSASPDDARTDTKV